MGIIFLITECILALLLLWGSILCAWQRLLYPKSPLPVYGLGGIATTMLLVFVVAISVGAF